jgi:hypothetical protein
MCRNSKKALFFWSYCALTAARADRPLKPPFITSERHSTVWDGGNTLFDFNFQALGIDPNECFETAFEEELKPGKYVRVYLPESVSESRKRRVAHAAPKSL